MIRQKNQVHNTPITTGLFDNRIANTKDALLRMIRGNLSHTKSIFTLHPKFSIHINDDISKLLSLAHIYERIDLFTNPENCRFSND